MSVIRKYVLSEFRGQTTRDSIDNQIENGVDFFPNTDAPGFTPKTDLESLYNKVKDGNLGPVGGNVDKYANLLAGQQSSQFSFPNADRENNINISPEGFSGLQTTFDLPRESFRFTTLGPENDTFQPTFSSTLGLGSSKFTDTIDLFHRYESSDFTNLPGISSDNLFFNRSLGEGGSFRKAADPVGLTHPILLRPFGSNWETAYEDLQVPNFTFKSPELKFGNRLGVDGVSFGTMASRNIADNARILRWSLTPDGASFITKQSSLQRMNPTIETKQFNVDSILGVTGGLDKAVLPIYHPERHEGGLASRYENVLGLTGLNPEPGIQLTGGSRLAYQAAAFTIDLEAPQVSTGNALFDSAVNFVSTTLTNVVNTTAASIAIGLSSPNRYSPFPSAAPISTRLGYVAFGTPTAQAAVDTLWVLNKPGGTFNKDTSLKSDKSLKDIKRHSTLSYTELDKKYGYETNLTTPREIRDQYHPIQADDFNRRGDGKKISDSVGHPGKLGEKIRGGKRFGITKGNLKSSNVDKVNALPYPLDYKESPDNPELKDFIKFRFRDVITNRYIIFRAILDGISDSITPEYGEERYIGRPDKVYVYQGADRTVSFNFSIYPKTKQEFPILMQKLNHLIGLCYPNYTEEQLMITPFIELTLGDMFVDAAGILSGLTVTVEESSTWEIDEGLQFPHYIKAACEFKYIGNNKLSSTSIKHYNGLDYKVPKLVEPTQTTKLRDVSAPINMDIEPVRVPYLPDDTGALAGTSA